jgi:hypothetical protein
VKYLSDGTTRSEVFGKSSNIWKELKEQLKELSHGKCWYCESSTHRITGDVDHHRPKGQIKHYPPDRTVPDLPGYWWLAFCWRNFRYSCEICNRLNTDSATGIVGGKGNYFPLVDPTRRICDECDYDNLLIEDPLLLDPTVVNDPPLLTFDLDGTARPACEEQEYPVEYLRAKISIALYHLNHTDLKKRRQLEVCYKVKKLVRKIDRYFPRLQQNRRDIDALVNVKEATEELKKMIHERAEYSSAAIAALKTFRGPSRKWIEPLLTA